MSVEISPAVIDTYNKVRDDKDNTNWAFFGFVGKADILEVSRSGEKGLDEFKEGLKSDEAGWGVVRLELSNDDYSVRTKFIIVQWIGKDVGIIRKGKIGTQQYEVQNKLNGFHLVFDASNVDDLDEKDIITDLKRNGGANYDGQISAKSAPVTMTTSLA